MITENPPPPPHHRSRRRPRPAPDFKRLLDLTLGATLLALTAPALTVAALTLALTRPAGGVLVREVRIGFNGHPFPLSSLRTRRFRLDLLSRLPHVVRGDLSLVGPAPLAPGAPTADARWRQLVRPGLTGLAQLRRHSPYPWDEAPLLDQHYVEHHWLGMDLAILVRTLPSLVWRGPGCGEGAGEGHLSDTDHREAATLRRNKWVPSARTH
ncbi:sugar transferase [Streptomyces sp. NPDC087850]|uniref:sugar transferase n=1 Tax=unclassified Streptomyces TaxID=2593676 RepID=UPI00380DC99C